MRIKTIIHNWRKNEWFTIVGISLFLIFLIIIPLIYGQIIKGPDETISGIHTLAPGDYPIYYSYINQIKNQGWLLFNQFTTENQATGVFNIVWFLIGKFANLFNLNAIWALKIFQLLCIPILVFSLYLFISLFISNLLKRRWALILSCLGSGFGVYFESLTHTNNDIYFRSADLWMAEATIFNTISHVPHFILATTLILLIFTFSFIALNQKKYYYTVLVGILTLLLFNFHPYHIPLIYLTFFTYGIIKLLDNKILFKQLFSHALILGAVSLPSIIYHFYTLTDPVIYARSLQNITLSSPFYFYILGLGIYFLLGIGGVYLLYKKWLPSKYYFLIVWILIAYLLAYLPDWQFQRRSIQGVIIAVVILSIEYLYYLIFIKRLSFFQNRLFKQPFFLSLIIIFIFAPSSFFLELREFHNYKQKGEFFYLKKDKTSGFEFLRKLPRGNVLSSQITSVFIPSHTGKSVFFGHAHETIDAKRKKQQKQKYFTNQMTESEELNFLKKYNLRYFWWDDILQIKYPKFDPQTKTYFQSLTVFDNQEIFIIEY